MTRPNDTSGLLDFATGFLKSRGITNHEQVHTEELVEDLRASFGVPPFPRLTDLRELYRQLGISLGRLPAVSEELLALHGWHEEGEPIVKVRGDLLSKREEHSLGHEVREVLENAFKRVDADYLGLETNDNDVMNPRSDHFASCLLMPAFESRELLAHLGYDFVTFARETNRSVSSVVIRAQSLFSAKAGVGPVAGLWLFEAPWELVATHGATPEDMRMTLSAQLNGFSQAKGRGQAAQVARDVFPAKKSSAASQALVREAIDEKGTSGCLLAGFDLFAERDFVVAVEPIFARGTPWLALMTAVRLDCRQMVRPWAERVDIWRVAEAVAIAGS